MNTAIINNVVTVAEISYGEKVLNGLIVVVVGMLAIFAVLAILWGVLALFKIFFYDMPAKKKAEEAKKALVNTPAPSMAPVPEVPCEAQTDDSQLIAVITAAIAAYTAESGKSALPFRVVSYKRLKGANGWNGADENETV